MCNINFKMCIIQGHGLGLVALIYSDTVKMFRAVCAHLENNKILVKYFPHVLVHILTERELKRS